MKKEAILLLLFIIILIMPAVLGKATCSDRSTVIWDEDEINIGSSKIINDVGIGVAKTEEIVFYRRVTAELIADARRIDLSNKTSSQDIEIMTGKHNIGFTEASDEKVIIKVDGESKEIEEKDIGIIKDLVIALIDSKNIIDQETIVVKLIAGYKQISLSNDQHPYEKITFGNATYFIELSSASSSNAIIKVSTCKTGEITEIAEIINKTEETISNVSNTTLPNKTADNKENDSAKQTTVAEVRERLKKLNETSNDDASPQGKIGFFRRIINWIKSLINK